MTRARISVGAPLLRLRSDDQLVALFRSGNDDAFRVIHDRYHQRLFAYARQMLPSSAQDAEDALQDVFVRAYSGLRANSRTLALRPWLYRVAHNRCVDELRRPAPPAPEVLHQPAAPTYDPAARAEQRESLQRLITDLRRLPDHQRSALLMRELGGMTYADVAAAMDVSVPAVKSLLVRARIGLALAAEARDTACIEIRDELTLAHDRGVRPSGTVRRHLADCGGCREFRAAVRGSRTQFAALLPALGPMGLLAKVLGLGGGGAAGGGAAATGGASATTGAVIGAGSAASVGTLTGASHVATLIAAAVVTAGGAVALQPALAPVHHRHAVHSQTSFTPAAPSPGAPAPSQDQARASYQGPEGPSAPASSPGISSSAKPSATVTGGVGSKSTASTSTSGGDNLVPTTSLTGGATSSTGTAPAAQAPTGKVTGSGSSAAAGGATGFKSPSGASTSGTGSPGPASSSVSSSTAGSGAGGTPGTSGSPPIGSTAPAGTTAATGPTKPSATGTASGTRTGTATGA